MEATFELITSKYIIYLVKFNLPGREMPKNPGKLDPSKLENRTNIYLFPELRTSQVSLPITFKLDQYAHALTNMHFVCLICKPSKYRQVN